MPGTPRPRTRRWLPPLRVWVWTAFTLALVVAAVVLWRDSDAAATQSTTAPRPAPLRGTPDASLSQVWSASGTTVPRLALQSGRVVVGTGDGLHAVDPLTGATVWSYRRTNARMCGMTAVDGVAVAVFQVPQDTHRCDQAVALDAATGVRLWSRNVRFSPDATLTATDRTVLGVSGTGLVAIDPSGDNERWRWRVPAGCRLVSVTPGSSGSAVLQSCPDHASAQLVLVDNTTGKPVWTRDLGVPADQVTVAGADGAVSVVVGNQLQVIAGQSDVQLAAVPLPATGGDTGVGEVASGGRVFVHARGTAVAVDSLTGQVAWQLPATGLPAVEPAGPGSPGGILVPQDGALLTVDPASGAQLSRSAVTSGPAPGGELLVTGPVVLDRTADRVVAYR